jgi:UDP-glucose 4-epimerase
LSVLVTGGMGVIGSLVVRNLIERGEKPVIYCRHIDWTLMNDIAETVEIVTGNVTDLAHLIDVIKEYKIKHIIHLASLVTALAVQRPKEAVDINIGGTVNVFEAARLTDIERVVFSSSRAVYAPIVGHYGHPLYKPINEDYPLAPSTIYGATKLFCEQYAQFYTQRYGLDIVSLRFSFTYSPGKRARHGASAIISYIVENAMLGEPISIPQGGDAKEDFIYNKDVAQAVILACYAKNLQHQVFHIGTGEVHSLREVADIVKRIFPNSIIEIGPGLDLTGRGEGSCALDISRARQELGYEPQYGLEEGINDYVSMLQELDLLTDE